MVKVERLADAQTIPLRFLESIMSDLRHAGVVDSRRGSDGGYMLARPAAEISLGEVIRAVDGPLAHVGGRQPDALEYSGTAKPLRDVWIGVQDAVCHLLEETSLADVAKVSSFREAKPPSRA